MELMSYFRDYIFMTVVNYIGMIIAGRYTYKIYEVMRITLCDK